MKRLVFFALALTAFYVGINWARRRAPSGPDRPEIDQWEGEGGAVPESENTQDSPYGGSAA